VLVLVVGAGAGRWSVLVLVGGRWCGGWCGGGCLLLLREDQLRRRTEGHLI
jgi:hypothetical protein